MFSGVGSTERYLAYLAVRNFAPSTIARRRWSLTSLERFTGGDAIDATPEQLEAWLGRFRSPASRHAMRCDVRALHAWARKRGWDGPDPTEVVEGPRLARTEGRPLTATQVKRLLHESSGTTRLAIMLACYAGLRRGEIANLRGEDVRHDLGVIVVRHGKGGHDRIVPMAPELAEALAHAKPGRLFHCQPAAITARVRRVMRRCGINDRPHCLRHTFATHAARASGGNVVLVSQLLGHASLATSQQYLRWAPSGGDVVSRLYA